MHCPLGYVIKTPCAYPQRSRSRWVGGLQILPWQVAPRPITGAISPSRAHLHKPRGAHGYSKTDRNPNCGFRVGDTLPGPSLGSPRKAAAPLCQGDTHHDESNLEHFLSCHLGTQGTLWEKRQCILGLHRTYYGMLRGESKGEERERFRWFGEEWEWGKQEGIRGLVAYVLLWPCPVPHQPVFLLKAFLTLSLKEGFSIWYEGAGFGRVWMAVAGVRSWVRIAPVPLCQPLEVPEWLKTSASPWNRTMGHRGTCAPSASGWTEDWVCKEVCVHYHRSSVTRLGVAEMAWELWVSLKVRPRWGGLLGESQLGRSTSVSPGDLCPAGCQLSASAHYLVLLFHLYLNSLRQKSRELFRARVDWQES